MADQSTESITTSAWHILTGESAPPWLPFAASVGALLLAALPKLAPYVAAVAAWLERIAGRLALTAERMREADPTLRDYFATVSTIQRQLDRVAEQPCTSRSTLLEARLVDGGWRVWVHRTAPPDPDLIEAWRGRPADEDYQTQILEPFLPDGSGVSSLTIATDNLADDSDLRAIYAEAGAWGTHVRRLAARPGRIWYLSCHLDRAPDDVSSATWRTIGDACSIISGELDKHPDA